MIVEQRTYTLHPGKVSEWIKVYEQEGFEMQVHCLGRMVGYFTSELGMLNQVVHLWAYEDLEDRRRRREALVAKPEWQALLHKLLPLVREMKSKILLPAPFSPTGDRAMSHDIVTELSSLEDRRCAALIRGDVAGVAELLSEDLLWTHSSARQDTKSSFLAALAEGTTRYLEIDRSDENIRVRGEVAVITGVADMRAVVNGEEKILRNRYLNVWVREDGRWRMSTWQSTALPSEDRRRIKT